MYYYVIIAVVMTTVAISYSFLIGRKKTHKSGLKIMPSLPYLPIIGSLPFLSNIDDVHISLAEKAKQYGKIYSFWAHSRYGKRKYAIVLIGHALREALVKRAVDFAGRGEIYMVDRVWTQPQLGIVTRAYGDGFKRAKLHTTAILKNFGFGNRHIMETTIHAEVEELLSYIGSWNGKPMDPSDLMQKITLNVVHHLLFSERFDYEDPMCEYLRQYAYFIVHSLDPLYDVFPLLANLPSHRKRLKQIRAQYIEYAAFIKKKKVPTATLR